MKLIAQGVMLSLLLLMKLHLMEEKQRIRQLQPQKQAERKLLPRGRRLIMAQKSTSD